MHLYQQSYRMPWQRENSAILDGNGITVALMTDNTMLHQLACERIVTMANAFTGIPTSLIANAQHENGQHIVACMIQRHEKLVVQLASLTEAIKLHKRDITLMQKMHGALLPEDAELSALGKQAEEYQLLINRLALR